MEENLKKEELSMESILTSIKKLLGIGEEYTHFDSDVIMHINSVLSILTQIGVGPSEGFSIMDKTSVWSDFVGDLKNIDFIRSYVYLNVKFLFDPPLSSVIKEIKDKISELEWRISTSVD